MIRPFKFFLVSASGRELGGAVHGAFAAHHSVTVSPWRWTTLHVLSSRR